MGVYRGILFTMLLETAVALAAIGAWSAFAW